MNQGDKLARVVSADGTTERAAAVSADGTIERPAAVSADGTTENAAPDSTAPFANRSHGAPAAGEAVLYMIGAR